MTTMFQQRHYEAVAKVIAGRVSQAHDLVHVSPWRMTTMKEICRDFALKFRGDNPNFKRHVFMKACGLPEDT